MELRPILASPLRRSVLVVDDDAAVRASVAQVLEYDGYGIHCAEDGEAGWNALLAMPFDALITDYQMPRLTGLDLIRRVRAASLPLPAILISGRMPGIDEGLLPLPPAVVLLRKPFCFMDMLAKLRSALGESLTTPHIGPSGTPVS